MHKPISRRSLPRVIATLSFALLLDSAGTAHAQTEATTTLKEVMVTATRSSQAVDIVPGTATTVNRDDIERRQANDIADLFRDEPDISITSDPRRFGTGTINIRGIEDNRVLLLIDGVRATDYRSPGTTNYDAANRDLPDPDFLKQVEIVRGPGSSLYGSDAIGGVVGFLTLDPEDFLTGGRTQAYGAKLSHYTENQGSKATAWAAFSGGVVKSLIMVSRLDAKETETRGSNNVSGFARTAANPQDSTSTSVLAKLAFAPAAGHEFRLGAEMKDKRTNTDIQRIANMSGTSLSRISQNTGQDKIERQRVVLDYIHAPATAWYDRLNLKTFWQRQESDDVNFQRRSNASLNAAWGCSASTAGTANCNVDQRFDFGQSQLGTSLVMEKMLAGTRPQFITWGADWLRATTEEVKYANWTNLATGVTSSQFLGESFPKSEYPKGHMDQFGIFGQDEIYLSDGRLRLTPGLRYDQFKLEPESDPLYKPVAGASAASKSGNRLSPKLAASFEFAPQWHAYGQYVEGYRAPNYEQVNRYFLNNQQFYGVVGNSELKPETSKGAEIGIKAGNSGLGGQIAVFDNRYRDFIDQVRLAAGDPARLPAPYNITYQYRNLQNVSIHGYELRGHWQARKDLKLSAAYAYAWGEYESSTVAGSFLPLNSIEPRRLTLAALWTPAADWGLETRVRVAGKQSRVDDSGRTLFRPAGYGVVDLGGWWQLTRSTRINLAIANLFDRKYWLWSDVRRADLPIGDAAPDFYTQPGRSLSLSLKLDF